MNKKIHYSIMILLSIVVVTGLIYYQFIYDPVIVEQIYDDNPNVKSVTKTTHLKDGTVDYEVTVFDKLGSK